MNTTIYEQLKEILGNTPENVSILEEQVDLKSQMEFYKKTKELKQAGQLDSLPEDSTAALNEEYPEDSQKELLVKLSQSQTVNSYRIIEDFLSKTQNETLRSWATLALQQSRMNLESHFLDENLVFVSTGLGGKASMLRFFVVVSSENGDDLGNTQQDVIKKEFAFAVEQENGEIEEIGCMEDYVRVLLVLPIETDINELVNRIISKCNELGKFIDENAIITNIKKLDDKEIREVLDGAVLDEFFEDSATGDASAIE